MHLSVAQSARIEVPEGAFAGDRPLVAVLRGSGVGSLHRGTVAAVGTDGDCLLSVGNPQQPAFLRSAAKPFQVMPAVLSGALDSFGIDERQLAVLCSSHNGEPPHLEAVASVLEKIGVPEEALHCGVHPPLDQEAAATRWRAGIEPTPICNNCSGAHAGMLLACRYHGWPVESYTDPDHPLQQMVRQTLASFAGLPPQRVELAVDNCAVPTFRLPLQSAALAFARLAAGRGLDPAHAAAARRIRDAMVAYPEMVGGRNRFDTDLMAATDGAVVCKGGAEGFQGIGLLEQGVGVAIKITDGNSRAIPPAAVQVLGQLEALSDAQLRRLEQYARPAVRNHQGEEVGRLVPVFGFEE